MEINGKKIYELFIDKKYENNPELKEIVYTLLDMQAQSIAHFFLLKDLLISKGIITNEEIQATFTPENLTKATNLFKDSYEKSMLDQVGELAVEKATNQESESND